MEEEADEEKEYSTPRSKVYGYYGRLSTPDKQLSLILFKTLCKPASAGWTEKVTAGMLGQRLGRRGMTVIILGFGKIPPELRNCSFLLHTGRGGKCQTPHPTPLANAILGVVGGDPPPS